MIRLTLLLVITAIASLAVPLDCAPGTLTDYLALDAEGCRLGTRVLSDFVTLPLTQGSTEIHPDDILVTPAATGLTGSLLFTYNASAAASAILQSMFAMVVNPDAPAPEKVDLRLIDAIAFGDGVVTGFVDLCTDFLIGGFVPVLRSRSCLPASMTRHWRARLSDPWIAMCFYRIL